MEGVKSEEVTWGDLYLSLQASEAQAPPLPIPGFPWEGIFLGLIGAIPIVIGRRDRALPRILRC